MDEKYDWEEWDRSSTTFKQHCIAGCIAGVSEHIVFFPVDTLRTNLQASTTISNKSITSEIPIFFKRNYSVQYGKYLLVRNSVYNNGVRVLWRGMTPTFLACIPAHAFYFSIYESIKHYFGGTDSKNIL